MPKFFGICQRQRQVSVHTSLYSRNKPPNVPKHDIRADGSRARGIGQDVRRDLGVAQSTKGEGACGDEERRAVADLRVFGGEEHDVPDHHEGGGADEEDLAFVEAG